MKRILKLFFYHIVSGGHSVVWTRLLQFRVEIFSVLSKTLPNSQS